MTAIGRLAGKVAVITGATSGMGLAAARLFAAEGARVYLTGRRADAVADAAASAGPNVIGVAGDAADLDDLDRLYALIAQRGDGVDIVYAHAGSARSGLLADVTEESFDEVFGLNVRGTLFTVQKALPLLRDGGSIILTGSVVAPRGWPGLGVYAASKAALRAFAGSWVKELAHRRIRVNVIHPGQIATAALAGMADDDTARPDADDIPLGRAGLPEEVAAIALFLASDESAYVNGTEIVVDGGAHST